MLQIGGLCLVASPRQTCATVPASIPASALFGWLLSFLIAYYIPFRQCTLVHVGKVARVGQRVVPIATTRPDIWACCAPTHIANSLPASKRMNSKLEAHVLCVCTRKPKNEKVKINNERITKGSNDWKDEWTHSAGTLWFELGNVLKAIEIETNQATLLTNVDLAMSIALTWRSFFSKTFDPEWNCSCLLLTS